MSRLAILAALWSPLVVSACCHDRAVSRPVVVRPPSCLTRAAPLMPELPAGAATVTDEWATAYIELSAWIVETEAACGEHAQPVAQPDPGPAWWTKQPSGAVGD